MPDLPYTYTDVDGDMLTVSSTAITATNLHATGTHEATVVAPTGEDAAELARTVLANPGPGDVRYVVVPEWQVIDPAELAAEKRAYAEATARSMRERALDAIQPRWDLHPDTQHETKRVIRSLPLLPDTA